MRWGRALVCGAVVIASIPLMGRPAAGACGLPGAPTATVYLPNITKTLGGPTGWVTPFIVQNVGSAVTTLEVSFYDFVSGALVTCRQVAGLAPQTSFADIPNSDADLPDGSAFSVVVRSFGSQVVAVVNEHQGEGPRAEALSYVGLSSGATRVGLPWVARADGGWLTTFIVQNLGTARASVTAAFVSEDGTKTATLSAAIEPGRSWAVNPASEPALLDGTSYAVLLTSDQPVGVVANAHNDAPTALQPMAFSYNGAPAETGETQVPWVARNADGGRTTTVVVQNLGSSGAQPTLTFRRIGGTEQAVVQLGALEPGRAARYTLPAASPACPVGGTEACPREGEHALAVSGGSFGVLAYSLGQAAAMGGTGSTTSSPRVYLPNITRTLGGVAGWTTPIVIQSAGATTAFLRWYRFADGQLAVTQYLGGLTSGRSVRVDPRDVAELANGTQYGVVVDGNGPLRAAVLELSSSGGDGAMAYDGFNSTGLLTPAPALSSVAVTPSDIELSFGQTIQLAAVVTDSFGNPVIGIPVTWTATPPGIGTISSLGLFRAGTTEGVGTITATSGSLTATARATVTARSGRAIEDRADDLTGHQVHVVYAVPSDGEDRAYDVDGTLARSIESFQRWLEQQSGRTLRIDTYSGAVDVSFVRLARSDSAMKALDPFVVTNIGIELRERGFSGTDKIYIVYYDGSSGYSCGGAAWPPTVPGNTVAMYLRGQDARGGPPCSSSQFTNDAARPGYWEYAMLHDTFHALGAVPTCASNHVLQGHVSDDRRDLMYSGTEPWGIYDGLWLDVGRDDYYEHSIPGCTDVSQSPYLTAP